MPAHPVQFAGSAIYWVGRCPRDGLLVHDPSRHGADFGMVWLHAVADGRLRLVDRLWPDVFVSQPLSKAVARDAVLAYLRCLQRRLDGEFSAASSHRGSAAPPPHAAIATF
jgi:hypothetical protein